MIIYNKHIAKILRSKAVSGLTLYPFILVANKINSDYLINHEKIHIQQQKELLVLIFYIWYLVEYYIHRINKSPYLAYKSISFEKECYKNDMNLEYLKTRKVYSFIKYIKHV